MDFTCGANMEQGFLSSFDAGIAALYFVLLILIGRACRPHDEHLPEDWVWKPQPARPRTSQHMGHLGRSGSKEAAVAAALGMSFVILTSMITGIEHAEGSEAVRSWYAAAP